MDKMRKTIRSLKEEQEKEDLKVNVKKKSSKKSDEVVVHISSSSVAKATLVVIGLLLLVNFLSGILDIIVVLFVSILFAAALDPTVDALEKYKIPRSVSVIGIFIVLLFLLGYFISQLIPLVAVQLFELAKNLTDIVNGLLEGGTQLPFGDNIQALLTTFFEHVDRSVFEEQLKNSLETLSVQLQSFAGDTFTGIISIFSSILNFALILILTFFLVVDEKSVDQFFLSLFPSKHAAYIIEKSEAVKHKVGYWLRGQVVMMVLMFLVTLITFLSLGVDYALTLAMMAGISELIPVVGPFLSGIPALLVAFNQSPWLALWVFIAIVIIQQLEGNVMVPLVMRKAVGLSPIIVIISMLVGYSSLGILGMIIAVPVATSVSIFVHDYTMKEK